MDGLRLDATQQMFDSSTPHVIAEITRAVQDAAGERSVLVVAENEPQDVQLVRSYEQGGYGVDALWNDDFHHSATVAATAHNEAYYTDYRGTPQELISSVKRGYLYQGQRYKWQKKRRGTASLGLPYGTFVNFLQNHDQVANSASGARLHQLTSPGKYRALTAFLLLTPATPMLLQGQEFGQHSVSLFCRPQAGACRRRAQGTRRVSRAVSFGGNAADPGAARRSGRTHHFRTLQARLWRARETRRRIRTAS